MLNTSPLMEVVRVTLIKRIAKMYIAKKTDGTIELMPDLDEKNPRPEQIRDVEEVYFISKVLVPVLTLKPKSKADRDEIESKPKKSKT